MLLDEPVQQIKFQTLKELLPKFIFAYIYIFQVIRSGDPEALKLAV